MMAKALKWTLRRVGTLKRSTYNSTEKSTYLLENAPIIKKVFKNYRCTFK
jgi:hypothetical protein